MLHIDSRELLGLCGFTFPLCSQRNDPGLHFESRQPETIAHKHVPIALASLVAEEIIQNTSMLIDAPLIEDKVVIEMSRRDQDLF